MKITMSKTHELVLTPEQSRDLRDEMKFACNKVSVFPVMERILELMEA